MRQTRRVFSSRGVPVPLEKQEWSVFPGEAGGCRERRKNARAAASVGRRRSEIERRGVKNNNNNRKARPLPPSPLVPSSPRGESMRGMGTGTGTGRWKGRCDRFPLSLVSLSPALSCVRPMAPAPPAPWRRHRVLAANPEAAGRSRRPTRGRGRRRRSRREGERRLVGNRARLGGALRLPLA